MMTNLDPTNSDPNAKAFLTKMQTDWGMDPAQLIDMNDPMTRLVMTMVITNVEQGRDLYSYDQFIKGCAMSAGIDPTTYDSEVNPTTLPIENNTSGAGGYVSVTAPNIQLGSGSLPVLQLSQYIQMGIQMSLNTPGYSGITSGSVVYGPGGVTGSVTGSTGSTPVFSNTYTGDNAAILATIKGVESGGDYTIQNPTSSASGAYQYIDSTWAAQAKAAGVDISQYPHAYMAPPEVQDAVASHNVDTILSANGNDVSKVPTVWYTGNAQGINPNVTPAQLAAYNNKWNNVYQQQAAKFNENNGPTTVTNPDGVPAGEYKVSSTITDSNGYDYKVLKSADGAEYRQYLDGSVTDSTGENMIKPPNGIPPGFTNVDTQTINGQDVNVYTKEGSNEKYYQNDNTGVITDANGVVQSPTANPNTGASGAIQVTELPDPNTGLTSAQQTAYNDVSGLNTVYAENAGKIDTLTAQNNDLSAQNAELQKTYDQNLNATGVPDTSITDKINANQQIIDSNKATADSLNAQNTDLQTQIQTGTDQYNAATVAAGQTTTIPPAAGAAAGAATGGAPTAAASASSAAAMPSGC